MIRTPSARVLPVTIAVAGLLLVLKSMSLGEAAFASSSAHPTSPVDSAVHGSGAVNGDPASGTAPADVVHAIRKPVASVPGQPPRDRTVEVEPERLSAQLRERQVELDERSAALDARQSALAAATDELQKRVSGLEELKAELQALEDRRKATDEKSWAGLVKVYETMRPANAAAIFDLLDTHVLLQVLDRMNERKAALVLADMQPERARLATQLLAQMRMKANADPKGASTGPG